MKKRWIVFITMVIVVLCLFSSPILSLRTHLFLSGHPVVAFETNFEKVESESDIGENAQLYELTKPPFETATQTELETFVVRKYGIFYIPNYYVDI